jgi:hypothetical protein
MTMSPVPKAVNDQQRAMMWALVAVRRLARRASRTAGTQANEERHMLHPLEIREPSLARIVARLRRDHSAMKGYRIRLATALGYWQQGDPKAASQAPLVADDYMRFCQRHVRTERDLLPALRKVTSEAEWAAFNEAVAAVADPVMASTSGPARFAALSQFD